MIAMTSHKNAFYLLGLCLWKLTLTSTLRTSFFQETRFITATTGGNETFHCFREESRGQFLLWFKQPLGQEPRLISTYYEGNKKAIFEADFEKDGRFSANTENKNYHLTIRNLKTSDSATYYCASKEVNIFIFGNGTFIFVRGSGGNSTALVDQPSPASRSCTVQTGSCGGEHSVYWFRGSGQPHAGLIYTQGGSSEQCERNRDTANTQPHMCAYDIKSQNISQALMCAVAACGQAVFKIGSKQRNEDEANFSNSLVAFLAALLIIIIMAIVLLAILLAKLYRRKKCLCKVSNIVSPSDVTPDADREDNLNYAALRNIKGSRSTRQPSIGTNDCVYASVRQ